MRKRTTYDTVKKIELYHQQLAKCEYEYLFLNDINLKLCTGCHLCMTRGEDLCPLKDDRDLIIKKIEESDGIILASPTFSMNVTWLMKNYLDRLSYLMHRPRFFGKKFLLLTVCGSIRGGKNALKSIAFGAFAGKIVNKLIVLNSPGMNENKKNKQELKIKKEALKFAKNMNRKISSKPPLVNLIWFSALKSASLAAKEECPADYNFYKNKKYFTDVNLSRIQNLSIKIFTKFFAFLVKKGYV